VAATYELGLAKSKMKPPVLPGHKAIIEARFLGFF
jgi:hypothetical protein